MSRSAAIFGKGTLPVLGGASVCALGVAAGLYVVIGSGPSDTRLEPEGTIEEVVDERDFSSGGSASENAPEISPKAPPESASDLTSPLVTSPRIESVLVQDDGFAIIAGQAQPGSEIAVIIDGAEHSLVTSGADGSFATILEVPPAEVAQRMIIRQTAEGQSAEGKITTSEDEILLAPIARTVSETVSGAAPDPENGVAPDTASDHSADALADADAVVNTDDAVTASSSSQSVARAPRMAALRRTQDGVERLDPQIALQDEIVLDTISYNDLGEVSLQGRTDPDREQVIAYLDNGQIASFEVNDEGRWGGAVTQIDVGVYNLRLDAVNQNGSVASRIETPFLREDPGRIAQAAALRAGATSITVQQGNTLWAIARDRYGEGTLYVQVVDANKDQIRNPDLIFPGQVFSLPEPLPEAE